ncbi:MAG: SulP family inorganic anion transporter [Candidatus Aenigmarchaeota archaeon]|nr:SulP family inorganic anion transporter [Candidatus Aenigmarchaeota archaeon]
MGISLDVGSYLRNAAVFDLKAGFITAVVALPLAIAFAIASGVSPIMGLYTAVIAGILGSTFGGSSFSITGPTGAMTVIILSTVGKFGVEGLLLAGLFAGLFQVAFGVLRLGKMVKFIPLPIVSGFTAGIGVIIFMGQIANFFGLAIPPHERIWETVAAIGQEVSSANDIAVGIALVTIAGLLVLPRILSRIPGVKNIPPSMVILLASTAAVVALGWSVPQVGNIPSGLPSFQMVNITVDLVQAILPAALTIALLGSIEALLCAVVCDGMTNTKHKSDRELVAQGIANVAMPFFGAIPSTAAIARSAVNIREGAKTRMAGIIHGVILLLVILFFAPYAQLIPKAFLAGILMVVSMRMINIHEFKTIMRISKADAAVLFLTFALTILTDLVFAVQVGMVLAIFLLFARFTRIIDISTMEHYDANTGINALVNNSPLLKDKVGIYTIHGPFFFGAMSVFERKLDQHIHIRRPFTIIRMRNVPFMDSTAVIRLNIFIRERQKQGGKVYLTGLNRKVRSTLFRDEEFSRLVRKDDVFDRTRQALDYLEKVMADAAPAPSAVAQAVAPPATVQTSPPPSSAPSPSDSVSSRSAADPPVDPSDLSGRSP